MSVREKVVCVLVCVCVLEAVLFLQVGVWRGTNASGKPEVEEGEEGRARRIDRNTHRVGRTPTPDEGMSRTSEHGWCSKGITVFIVI
jgi:hypothetical protein